MTKNRKRKQDARRLAEDSGVSYIQALRESRLNGVLHGIPTPLPTLSGYLNGGWQPGQLITVGARPGVGKTIFVSNAVVTALRAKRSVLYFSLEMARSEVLRRINPLMEELIPASSRALITVEDDYNQTVDSIRSRVAEVRPDLVLIDSLQLITPSAGYSSRREATADIPRKLKVLAQELQLPVILFSQLNRDRRVSLMALSPSTLALDSDVVILLDREAYWPGALSIMLEKNRVGESQKTIYGYIDPKSQRIRDLATERPAQTNPILRQWAEDLLSGELTLALLLEGWTVDGPGATKAQKDEARAEMLSFEERFAESILKDGMSIADEPIRSAIEAWAGRAEIDILTALKGDASSG